MKKLITLILICFISICSFSQDVIYKKNGEKINGKIRMITPESVQFKSSNQKYGPIQNIFLYDVYMIQYKDGREEFFKQEKPTRDYRERFFSNIKNLYYISTALGVGQSYGGIGLRLQGRIGKILGFGYHAGVGYIPSINGLRSYIAYSVGLKFFWYKGWYLDFQYCVVGPYSYHEYPNETVYGLAYGPSILVGGDWFFNKFFGINGAVGFCFNVTEPKIETVVPALDLGFVVKFY